MKFNSIIYVLILAILILAFGIIYQVILSLTIDENSEKFTKRHQLRKQWFLNILKPDHKTIGYSFILGLCIAILGMSIAVFAQQLIDQILPSKNTNMLIFSIVIVSVLLLVKVFFTTLRDNFLISQSKDLNNRIIDRFYTSLLRLPKPFFDTRKIGELVARFNDTQRIQNVIKVIIGNVVIHTLISIVSLAFLFYYSWKIGLIAAISLPFYFLFIYGFNTKIIVAQKEIMRSSTDNESNYINSIQNISTIKNTKRLSVFQKMNQRMYGNFQDKIFQLGKINVRLSLFSSVFGVLFLMGVLMYAAFEVYSGFMLIGELTAVLCIASSLLPSVASLALVAIPINEAQVAFDRMHELIALEEESSEKTLITQFESLTITDVSFAFSRRKQILNKINIQVSKNQCIAIVGESDCGKTTLSQLIQKKYTHTNGEILVNEKIPLQQISTKDWHTMIGVIPQEIIIFPGTLFDNIVLGKKDSLQNVDAFITEYSFEDFIQSLPKGYATLLGKDGINLSDGQKQILALIRVLYKKPQVLILDEFTATMDRNTAMFVFKVLKQLKSKITIIIISHHLQYLKLVVDEIYIIQEGETKVHGSHRTLLKTQNFYSDFWEKLLKTSEIVSWIS
ncbi:Multidrug resistance ABC transporter ATP-binding and permease protein [Kordia antarctica]|uniref:Multidrug resistance ABC transporter ATP-binding and permease protein n=1 Tax=Kordia antarctica TaxID=1218801 RepID=A0A7L4ZIC0_9FLAO|nr:ABC transporter transmembrane domain-containing protein [Kordia antarctica]QHI36270.1 Multidrug resistance ABC transporter ATP-binding and permease protein [Kordia antarctica]